MIIVTPEGRLANNIFQYVFARLIHEKTGLALNYTVGTSLFSTPMLEGIKGEGEPILVSDFFDTGYDHVLDIQSVFESCKGKNVHVRGFFQNKDYFNHKRQEIKSWLGEIPSLNKDFTGIHIRKTDYKITGWELPNSYYDECIKLANPSKLVIFTDDPYDPYVRYLISQGAQLNFDNPEKAMFLLGTCGKQIISRSTFSWWSAFLSNSEKIYYPQPLSGWWSLKDTPHKCIEVNSPEYCYIQTP